MAVVEIEGYLLQPKLAAALRAVVGEAAWRGSEVRVDGPNRYRWDMVYALDGRTVAVEFDGPDHYRNALKIKIDNIKDTQARDLGWLVVRVPYWIQLTTQTLQHYFGLDAVVRQNFPHGFIAKSLSQNGGFPASYCELGIKRFERELASVPPAVRTAVLQSLRMRADEHGIEYVLPTPLAHLLEAGG